MTVPPTLGLFMKFMKAIAVLVRIGDRCLQHPIPLSLLTPLLFSAPFPFPFFLHAPFQDSVSLYSQGWPHACNDSPASAFQIPRSPFLPGCGANGNASRGCPCQARWEFLRPRQQGPGMQESHGESLKQRQGAGWRLTKFRGSVSGSGGAFLSLFVGKQGR